MKGFFLDNCTNLMMCLGKDVVMEQQQGVCYIIPDRRTVSRYSNIKAPTHIYN